MRKGILAVVLVAIPLLFVVMVALPNASVHAQSNPTIVSIDTQGCANDRVCVTLTVDNPVAGTITLKLTGHTPGSSVFVDTGARLSFTIVPGTTTYTGCFDNVSSFTAGKDFNTLRVEFASSDIANLDGTTTKSVSFAPCVVSPAHATITAELTCTQVGKVCFNLTVSTMDFPAAGRDVMVTLLGHKSGDTSNTFSQIGQPQTLHLDSNLDNASVKVCFDNVATADLDSFKLDIKAVGPDFDVNGQAEVALGPFQNSCPTPTPTPTPTPSPSPIAGTGSPSPTPSTSASAGSSSSPSASAGGTGAGLPSTGVGAALSGGFDYLFAVIFLLLILVGTTALLIAHRRRLLSGPRKQPPNP